MNNPYKGKKIGKFTKSSTSKTETQTHTPSKDTRIYNKKIKKINILKGGSVLEEKLLKLLQKFRRKVIL